MALSTGTYYASQTIGSCESALRFAVTVTVNFARAPAGAASQDFCAVDNPTVANLTATGTAIKWYPAATGGTALATTTALSSGTYYASQTIGTCESDSRLAVTVSVNADPVTSGINGDNAPLCMSTGVTYSVVPTAGSTYAWTVPAGANIASGGSGRYPVDFGSESGLITVTETSATGCQGDPVQLAIDLQGCALHAGFSADPTAICLGENVVFTDTSEGTNAGTLYAWDFGEGAAPATANTAGPHTVMYTTPGAKTVSLTISNGISSTITQDNYITVNAVPVVALEGADRCGPGTVDFTATLTDGDQVDFSLDNGTFIISSVSAPPYVYTATLR
jgi:PKD repeat protein